MNDPFFINHNNELNKMPKGHIDDINGSSYEIYERAKLYNHSTSTLNKEIKGNYLIKFIL